MNISVRIPSSKIQPRYTVMCFCAGAFTVTTANAELRYTPSAAAKEKGKKAVKCDACLGEKSGPACVNACPTGAAIRIGPERFIELIDNPSA